MKKYLVVSPAFGEEYFSTEEEALEHAKKCMEFYLDDNEGWADEVRQMTICKVTHVCAEINKRPRPDNLEEDLRDENGYFWPEHVTHICDYEMSKL